MVDIQKIKFFLLRPFRHSGLRKTIPSKFIGSIFFNPNFSAHDRIIVRRSDGFELFGQRSCTSPNRVLHIGMKVLDIQRRYVLLGLVINQIDFARKDRFYRVRVYFNYLKVGRLLHQLSIDLLSAKGDKFPSLTIVLSCSFLICLVLSRLGLSLSFLFRHLGSQRLLSFLFCLV